MYIKPQREQMVQIIAERIHQRGLGTAAQFALEVGQPFAWLGGQLLWLAQPALGVVGAGGWAEQWAILLEEPAALEQMRHQLAALEHPPTTGNPT